MVELDRIDVVQSLEAAYGAVTGLAADLAVDDFARPTRCEGLAVGPLLVHLLLDAQRALMTFVTPAAPPPDRDFVTYWRDFPADPSRAGSPDTDPHVRFVTQLTAAYARPDRGLVAHWRDTAEAATRAAAAAPPTGYVATQGHVLAVPDFVATLVFEATVHHLDLTLDLPAAPPPDSGLDLVAAALDGLVGAPARDRTGWDATTYALKATGRTPLDASEADLLGPDLAGRLPVIG